MYDILIDVYFTVRWFDHHNLQKQYGTSDIRRNVRQLIDYDTQVRTA